MGAQEDAAATKAVLEVLKDSAIRNVDFTLGEVSISPTMYDKVAEAITQGKITVIVAPNFLKPTEAGRYFPVLTVNSETEFYDVLVLRTPGFGSGLNAQFHGRQAVVHECTHAGLDLLKVPNMTHAQHEAVSYVADSIFLISKVLAMKGDPGKIGKTIVAPIEKAAWEVGMLVSASRDSKNGPSAPYWSSPDFAVAWFESVNRLFVAIGASDEYKASAKDKANNDGVGRPWKLPKKP
jgi:hypothetical protein